MKVAIVGGGIAGLAAAYYLQKEIPDCDITLIERSSQVGGKIVTDSPGGFVIEGGPDSFITQKPYAFELCRELGIEHELIGTNDARRTIFILRDGKLHRMPDGLMLVVPTRFMPFIKSRLISWRGKLRMGMDLFIPARQEDGDESIASFMRRRLGAEALDILGEPILAGIHVADAERLSLQATFPRFIDTERKYGSLIRGMIAAKKKAPPASRPMFMTLKDGLRGLITALENAFTGEIITGTCVKGITRAEFGWTVTLENDEALAVDAVILATPAFASAKLLQSEHPTLARQLNAIRYVSTATISLGYAARDIGRSLDGFGFVIPRSEPTRLLACTWTSTKFNHRAPDDHVLIRVFVGGTHHEELVAESDETLIDVVREELKTIMAIDAEPVVSRVFRWQKANPQYDVGHLERIDHLESLCPPGLYLTGSAYLGVGIPDCINQGQQTARKIAQDVSENQVVERVTV